MEIRCRCPSCQAKFKVDGKYAGKKARCPKCQTVVEVPHQSIEDSTLAAPAPAAVLPPMPKPAAPLPPMPAQPASVAAPTAPAPEQAAGGMPAFNFVVTPPNKATTTNPAAAKASGDHQPGRVKKGVGAAPLILAGGGVLALLMAVGVGAAVMFGDSPSKTDSAASSSNAKTAASASGVLELTWAPKDRRGGGLMINGRREPVPLEGELKFSLGPGEHKLFLQRRGYEPIDATVKLEKGEHEHFVPEWKESSVAIKTTSPSSVTGNPGLAATPTAPTPAVNSEGFPIGTAVPTLAPKGFEGWLQNLDAAKRQAAQEKKDLLIVFGCSDAQRATHELARKLQQVNVQDKMVRVIIDYPRTSEGFNLIEDRGQNELLIKEFGLDQLPAIALADEQGRTYFMKREWEDGFNDLATNLPKWQEERASRDALLTAAEQASGTEQLQAAAKVIKWLQDKTVWRFYRTEIARWMAVAQRQDPDNKQALLETIFEPYWFLKLIEIDGDDTTAVNRAVAELDPWVTRKFQDQDRGAKLHMTAAFLWAQSEEFDRATTQMEHAVKYQPRDTKLAETLKDLRTRLENKDVLGSGTGFLISSAGYVLTNNHVIEGDGKLEVRLPDKEGVKRTVSAEVIAKDESRDIALLRVALPAGETFLPVAVAPEEIGRAEEVAAFGYPLSDSLGAGLKFTRGSISALPDPTNNEMYLLDLRVNPGNSGGPLCDRKGNVVGMITAKTGSFGFEDSYALAIPGDVLIRFLDEHLPADAKRAEVGDEAAGGWADVDRKVQTGVLMILKKK